MVDLDDCLAVPIDEFYIESTRWGVVLMHVSRAAALAHKGEALAAVRGLGLEPVKRWARHLVYYCLEDGVTCYPPEWVDDYCVDINTAYAAPRRPLVARLPATTAKGKEWWIIIAPVMLEEKR